MNVVIVALIAALLVSLIVNYVLVEQLEKASKKMEDMENERRW